MEQDSIRLLRECDAGVKMGVGTIENTLQYADSGKLRALLQRSRVHHLELGKQIGLLLDEANDEGKSPGTMAKGMSMLKTTVKLGLNPTDQTVATLITEGCEMGVRSLGRYLNEYAAAEPPARRIAQRLIEAEEELRDELRAFL